MKQLLATIKAWWAVYVVGIVTPPEDTGHRLSKEEALELFQGEEEEEWEEE